MEKESFQHGILAWFARNHVAANLLMGAIVAMGLIMVFNIRQEVFPIFALDTVRVSVQYRGASPEEVEQSVILPIEAELRGLEMVRRLEAVASEGNATVTAEIAAGFDRNRALQEVTAAVQRISLFPEDVEPPVISLGGSWRRDVMRIAIYGDVDERTLVSFARQLEAGLLSQPDISAVEVRGAREPEIQVEVPQENLRALGLTLQEVASAIQSAALDVPAGTLRTPGGEMQLRTQERREAGSGFAELPILSTADGSQLQLSDFSTVIDGFEDSEREAYFNGKRSVFLSVFSAENQAPLTVAKAVRRFVEREQKNLPESINISLSSDRSVAFQERVKLLLTNGAMGLLLVLLALGLMLELRVAFWTAVGIPISILGSIALLPVTGSSINMISLFGFIVTLGIVVDDAIVVGEDIFHKISEGMPRLDAAIRGVKEMTTPVLFAVSTNIIAFMPLMFVPGEAGQFFKVLPAVVIAVFAVSLIECLLILPSHLATTAKSEEKDTWFARFERRQTAFREKLDRAMERLYKPALETVIRFRVVTIVAFVSGLLVVCAYLMSGRINFTFRPTIEADFIQAEIEMPSGTPVKRTREVCFLVERAAKRALELAREKDITVGIFVEVAQGGSNLGQVAVTLVPQSEREITGQQFADLWREQIPRIPDVESIFFDYLIGPGGEAEVDIELAHPDLLTLQQATEEVAAAVARYPGVKDVRKGTGREKPEMNFEITPEGRSLGVTAAHLGRQIRNAFYGAEALRQPRGRDELRVMVRLPEEERRSMRGIENLLIRTPEGGEIPLSQAATTRIEQAPVRIERVNGGRVSKITANVIPDVTSGNKVLGALAKRELPEILDRNPGLTYTFEGEQREQREAMSALGVGLIGSLFAIYALMAALLRSYIQAFVVLLTIPFSLAGAVIGHVLLGFDLSVFSVFGMIALCGMVVNGGFVLAVTRNRYLDGGIDPSQVTALASLRRFRPILLTAATTFLGLAPMIFETSIQALFLVPMAISLGIGTLASAVVILLILPAILTLTESVAYGEEPQASVEAPAVEA